MSSNQPTTKLMVLMFTDLAGSVDLKTRLGAPVYAGLISRHDALFKQVMASIPHSQTIKDTGDGFLARFETASDAVRAALCFQYMLKQEPWVPEPVGVRIGLHIGQVTELDREAATGLPKLVGLAADIAARVMDLATPGQILMTRTLFDDARQFLREHPTIDGTHQPMPQIKWMAHGPYLFKGSDEPMDVFEVGAIGIAPLQEPPDSAKARRAVRPGEESLFGWRPAIGLPIPGRDGWLLEQKLGEGGFGEVWLARQQRTKDARVFKFCFDADRLRSFKREMTLFRLLREALGDRRDIAKLWEVRLDEPPYYLESAFTREGDLTAWSNRIGGISTLPLAVRIELLASIADAVAAAHSVGVLHKDIKPSNVLIEVESDGTPRPLLADFGIGMISDPSQLHGRNITVTGFTETVMGNESSRTGTRMYSPPEMLSGQAFTTKGDVFALGVMLYQLVVGDLSRPLAHGWERDIEDPLLREDIAAAVAGDVNNRIAGASELADRLRRLPQRRAERTRQRRLRMASMVAVMLALLLVVAGGLVWRERGLREEANEQRQLAIAAQGKSVQQREEIAGLLHDNQTRLVRSYVEKGWNIEGGDLRQALLWFTKALEVEPGDEKAQRIHRLRIASIMQQLPQVEHQVVFTEGTIKAVSADGEMIVVYFHEEFLHVLVNVKTGARVTLRTDEFYMEPDRFVRDGKILVGTLNDSLAFWDTATGKLLFSVARPDGELLDFDSNEKRFIMAKSSDGLEVRSVDSGEVITSFAKGQQFDRVKLNRDGAIAVTQSKGHAQIWDVKTGNPLGEPMSPVTHFVLSDDGTKLATIDHTGAVIYDARSGKPILPLMEHESQIIEFDFDPQSRLFVYSTADGFVHVRDAVTGEPKYAPLSANAFDAFVSFDFNAEGSRLVSHAGGDEFRIWDISTGQQTCLPFIQRIDELHQTHFNWASPHQLVIANQHTVRLWNIEASNKWQTRLTPSKLAMPENLKLSSATASLLLGGRLAFASTNSDGSKVVTASFDGHVRAWDVATKSILFPPIPHVEQITMAQIMPDGRRFITVDLAGSIRIFDLATGSLLSEQASGRLIGSAVMNRDGSRLITVSPLLTIPPKDMTVSLWDLKNGEAIVDGKPWNHEPRPAFDRQGKRFFLLGEQSIHVFDASTFAPLGKTIDSSDYVHGVAFCTGGYCVIAEHDAVAFHPSMKYGSSRVIHWDIQTGEAIKEFTKPPHMKLPACFDVTGQRIAITSDKTVRVWDLNSQRPVTAPMTTSGRLNAMTFSHDGTLFATASNSGSLLTGIGGGSSSFDPIYGEVRIWDAATGEAVTPPIRYDYHISAVRFTADDRRVMVMAADDTHLFDLYPDPRPVEELVELAQIQASAIIDDTASVEPLDGLAQKRFDARFKKH